MGFHRSKYACKGLILDHHSNRLVHTKTHTRTLTDIIYIANLFCCLVCFLLLFNFIGIILGIGKEKKCHVDFPTHEKRQWLRGVINSEILVIVIYQMMCNDTSIAPNAGCMLYVWSNIAMKFLFQFKTKERW